MSTKKFAEMADTMKRLVRETQALAKHNAASGNFENTKARRDSANESARECAIEIRRLKHEAHCIAVEMGIAERRDPSAYTDSTAPGGFGRTFAFVRREPKAA